jgi:hypothetical protein
LDDGDPLRRRNTVSQRTDELVLLCHKLCLWLVGKRTAPAAALITPKADFLLEVLIVALERLLNGATRENVHRARRLVKG